VIGEILGSPDCLIIMEGDREIYDGIRRGIGENL